MSKTFTQLDGEERKRLLDKLSKLKALSECRTGNVNETASAAATMTRIMLEYQIGMADLEGDSQSQDQTVGEQQIYPEDSFNGYPVWKKYVLTALADVNHCLSYTWSSVEYSRHFERRTRSRLTVIGAPADIESTVRLYHFCVAEIERLCTDWGRGKGVKLRNDFKRGAALGIATKVLKERDAVVLEEQQRASSHNQVSPALQLFDRKQDAVEAYAAEIGVCYTSRRRRGVTRDAFDAGFQAGSQLDLGRGSRPALPALCPP